MMRTFRGGLLIGLAIAVVVAVGAIIYEFYDTRTLRRTVRRGEVLASGSDQWRFWAERRAGRLDECAWREMEDGIARSVGTCMTMGTASTMAAAVEALGLTLPGGSSIPAVDSNHPRLATRSGRRIVEMVEQDLRPRRILTLPAFENAVTVAMALGGSTNAIVHLVAMAGRAGVALDLDRFDALSRRTPFLANVRPSGKYLMEDFYYAGGLPAVMRELGDLIHGDAITVSGKTVAQNIAEAELNNAFIYAPISGAIHSGEQLAADRYSYLSCLGWALLLGGAVGTVAAGKIPRLGLGLRRVALAIVGLYLAKGVSSYASTYLMSYVGQRTVMDLRNRLYRHILGQSIAFFSRKPTGTLMSHVTTDVEKIQQAVSEAVGDLLMQSFAVVGYVGLLFYYDWKLAAICLVSAPLAVYPLVSLGRSLRRTTDKGLRRWTDITNLLQETISGSRIVKAFGMEAFEAERFRVATEKLFRTNLHLTRVVSTLPPLMELVGGLAGHLQRLLGVVLPVGGQMQVATGLELARQQAGKGLVHQAGNYATSRPSASTILRGRNR